MTDQEQPASNETSIEDERPSVALGDDEQRTDLGNARRLVCAYGSVCRFIPEQGRWFEYQDGRQWKPDILGQVERWAKEVARRMMRRADELGDVQLGKWAFETQRLSRLRNMLELAKTEREVVLSQASLDRNLMLLNVLNGVMDLASGELRKHRSEDYHTRLAPVQYTAGATAAAWEGFLGRVFDHDEQLIGFVQRAVGYSLTGLTSEQVLFMPWGPGANGKSTFLEVLQRLLGDYATTADASTFLDQRRDGARNDLARLHGARFVAAIEVERGARLAESLVKSVTGQDRVTARFLFREYFTYTPQFKVWLAVNHKPVIRGAEHAIWRRIRLIPFTITIPAGERDARLVERLMTEAPGILNWALEGLRSWREQGLGSAPAVEQATAEYRAEMDSIGDFLAARCLLETFDPSLPSPLEVGSEALFTAYKQFAEHAGERPMGQKAFVQALLERGLTKCRTKNGARWQRIALKVPGSPGDGMTGDDAFLGKFPYTRVCGELPENPSPPVTRHPSSRPVREVTERQAIAEEGAA